MPAVRSDWKKSKALEWLVDHVEVVDPDGQPIDRALLEPDLDQPQAEDLDQQRRQARRDRRTVIKPVAQYHIPGVFEQTNRGEKSYDLFSRMLEENIVFLGTPIDDYVANAVCAQMLYLEYKNSDKEISLYINSPGGDITALFAIYDTMKFVKNDISTFCYGQAASAAAVILAGGTSGQALRPAARPHPDPSALWGGRRPGRRHRDPGQGDPAHAGPAQPDAGGRHRPVGREGGLATPIAISS